MTRNEFSMIRATRKMKSEKSKRGRGGRGWPYKRRRYVEPSSTVTSAQATETKKPGLCFGCSLPYLQHRVCCFVFSRGGCVKTYPYPVSLNEPLEF